MRGYACIGLDNPRSAGNIGGVIRAACIYEAAMVVIKGRYYKKNKLDTTCGYRHMPVLHVNDLEMITPYKCTPVAVDIIHDAIPLNEYKHPTRAFYIFGSESATLGDDILSWCQDIVFIPTKQCMNLAATVNVVLYDRQAKGVIKCQNVRKK